MQDHKLISILRNPRCYISAVIASILLILVQFASDDRIMTWDEVDYALASKQGFLANYFDSSALTAIDFIRFSKSKISNQPLQLDSYYKEESDVFLLRHMHPPLLQYLMNFAGLQTFFDGHHDQFIFWFQIAGGIILITLINSAVLLISNNYHFDLPTLIVMSATTFLTAFYLTREVQYHLWFTITLLLVSFIVGIYLKNPDQTKSAWLGTMLAFSFITLETGLFAFALTIVLIVLKSSPRLNRENLRNFMKFIPWRDISIITLFMAIFIFLLWPASVLKLSLPRIISIYAYRIYLGNEYSGGNQIYLSLLYRTLPVSLVAGFGMFGYFKNRKNRERSYKFVLIGLGLGYGLIMLKFMVNITYMVPALTLLLITGLTELAEVRNSKMKHLGSMTLVILTGIILSTAKPLETQATPQGIVNLATLLEQYPAYIEAGHIYQYYLPDLSSRINRITLSNKGDSITVRRQTKYEPVSLDQLKNHVILFYNRPELPPSSFEAIVKTKAEAISLPGVKGRAYLMKSL